MCVCVWVCVRACVYVRVPVCVYVHAGRRGLRWPAFETLQCTENGQNGAGIARTAQKKLHFEIIPFVPILSIDIQRGPHFN